MTSQSHQHHAAHLALSTLEETVEYILKKVTTILSECDWVDSSISILKSQVKTLDNTIELNINTYDPNLIRELLRLRWEILNTTSIIEVKMNALLGRTGVLADRVRQNILSVKRMGHELPIVEAQCEKLNSYLIDVDELCSAAYSKIQSQILDLNRFRSS